MGNVSKHLTQLFKVDIGENPIDAIFPDMHTDQLLGLNAGQQEMVKGINEYLLVNKDNKEFFMVQGGGGFGKSYSILRAISHISSDMVIGAAPSHFAKNVLQDFLGASYRVVTVASLLGMRLSYDRQTGEDILIKNKGVIPPIEKYDVVIIDEASMINDKTVGKLIEACRYKKLIVLGDYAQLPPVGQDTDSLFFNDISVTLTQPMRFTGFLFTLTQEIRKEIDKIREDEFASPNVINMTTSRKSELDASGSGYIFMQSRRTLLTLAVKKFKLHLGSNYIRIIAYRNATIEMLNKTVRLSLYGSNAAQFEIGEIVISNGGYTHKKSDGKVVPLVNNGEVFTVRGVSYFKGPYELPCVNLDIGEDFIHALPVVTEEGKIIYDKMFSRMVKMAENDPSLWGRVKEFENSFAKFDYAYAVSTHKSQGSTIKHVFVLEGDILSVKPTTLKEKLQSLYVGISRASYRSYIFNKMFKVDNTDISKEKLMLDE